ncbi:hypothetical protein DY000_02018617 [Brassica cretica]|uniref:Uncharacterized protein n=1 Tax=Brassica cretica TaxID=69181 RepID=A0ABQ7CS02_BRACR|nr:hypothetical protein DY000_02018617 [Brassica cretica]
MKKKKPKKSKSPASKSASKTSPSKDSPVKSVDSDSDSPHSEFVSDAHNDIPVEVVAQLPLVSSDLESPPAPPSDQAVIVDSLTDPSGKIEVDLPIVSSSDKTVIADPSADPSSAQEVIPMILLESSSVIQATCSSVLPSDSLQTTNDGSYLEPAVQAPIAEAEKKSSCSHLAEAIDNTVTPSVVPEEETRSKKRMRFSPYSSEAITVVWFWKLIVTTENNQISRANGIKIIYGGWEGLLEGMKKARRLNNHNHVFSMLKACCPLEDKTACDIKQSGALLPRVRFGKGKISGLKVLVVPDYVDKIKQLGVIVKRLQWFGSGSSL